MKIKVKKKKKPCTLLDCPIGLFLYSDNKKMILCVKTEYGTLSGGVEAYIVSSGEQFSCNGLVQTANGCRSIIVFPCKATGKQVI